MAGLAAGRAVVGAVTEAGRAEPVVGLAPETADAAPVYDAPLTFNSYTTSPNLRA